MYASNKGGSLLRQALRQSDPPAAVPTSTSTPIFRPSNGLREFWSGVERVQHNEILDLGAMSQSNLSFITGRGYRLYTEDLIQVALHPAPQPERSEEPQCSEEERFFSENMNYEEGQFAGVLCWDVFDILPETLVNPFVEKLYYFLKPGGILLALFHAGTPGESEEVPLHHYRISSINTLEVAVRTTGKLRRHINNRAIEKLFHRFSSLKFYLSRDKLREVIVVR